MVIKSIYWGPVYGSRTRSEFGYFSMVSNYERTNAVAHLKGMTIRRYMISELFGVFRAPRIQRYSDIVV